MNIKSTLTLTVFVVYCAVVGVVLMIGNGLRNESIGERIKPIVAPDFQSIEQSDERKKAFLAFFRPLINEENNLIAKYRKRLIDISEDLDAGDSLSGRDEIFVDNLVNKYQLDQELSLAEQLKELLLHIDEVPVALVLVQAAIESGWGTSRFAEEGNNYFGQWCFSKGCGLVPNSRMPGKTHEVAVFNDPRHSIKAYMLNLNRFDAYSAFRTQRAELRANGDALSALTLVGTLSQYSERGQTYIDQVKNMIRANGLE